MPESQYQAFRNPQDRMLNGAVARLTQGLSPISLTLAWFDWAAHLAMAPGLQMRLIEKTGRKAAKLALYARRSLADPAAERAVEPLPGDHRFNDPEWGAFPFNLYAQSFLLSQQWWYAATHSVRGPSQHHQDMVWFVARQMLDVMSPANFIATNPVLLKRTLEQGGTNLLRGWQNWVEDQERRIANKPPAGAEAFQVGRNLALTPGKVVFRNHLIELIQYAPTTAQVHPEPVLIVPAWIMKYYILDLTPQNSLVKFLVDRGHTVFMISWRNPHSDDHALGMEDYLRKGVFAALDAINAVVPGQQVHGVGYCLGGTLLTIAAAALDRDDDRRLASMTLFAAQTDFRQAGELLLFIDDSQVTFIEDMMWDRGYLDASQMAGAFQMLRSNDLLWSRMVREYVLGERTPLNELMAWNADPTRMPYKMHKEYLHSLFLDNALANGHYLVDERPVAISDIRCPIFAVGADADHIAPWQSVYKIQLQSDVPVTFLLASGGHNAGIVSEPGRRNRRYQVATRSETDHYVDPETWRERTPVREGSWWPQWADWLAERSGALQVPPALGRAEAGLVALCDAPGTYVFQT
ncbi:polyhydroxyalkanoate synthase [Plasticicumulans lactativorans]|uniref:Polyhydroxyalkanoate synthase n=1 Tax=Plasticicumulans lactativorans TaxID=1133106 RepID=A0A4R2L3Q8_9GAMM|nr:alpha/beta fold hydrolase [Plasticicumulans lactativorans]TCO80352.1 polyhydroxyalkanoate synthase [Plasticicumulans lactativorans]